MDERNGANPPNRGAQPATPPHPSPQATAQPPQQHLPPQFFPPTPQQSQQYPDAAPHHAHAPQYHNTPAQHGYGPPIHAPAPIIVVQNQIQSPYQYPQQYGHPYGTQFPVPPMYPAGAKNQNTALLLAIVGHLTGITGLQRFYLNEPGIGVLYLFTFGLCGIGQLVDTIRIAAMSRDEFHRRYNLMLPQ